MASTPARWSSRRRRDVRAAFPVVVIGCGESGLLAGIRLREAGIPFTIVEKNAGPGGTWYENSYPGARVDVGNHFYCYSFEPSDHWTEFFAQQPELAAYFRDVMNRHGIEPDIRWSTEVIGADWSDETGLWQVRTRDADGNEATLPARAIISAVGQLNRPHTPDIKGMHDFKGAWFHSSNWDHSVDHRGKKVAMIGAGASGFQIAPTIAPEVAELNVFQRTAQWMFPNPNYHAKVGDGFRWALRHLPYYGRWFRFLIFWPASGRSLEGSRVDPDWPDQQRAISATNDVTRQMFTQWIESQVGDDAQLLAKVIPDYPATGKRTLQDNGSWLTALKRDNVELIRDEIDHIDETGIVTVTGERYEADIIVYATGFYTNRALWPMQITSRGKNLGQLWGESPSAYLGITIPGLSQPVLHVRAGHQPCPRRQPDLSFRMPDALHHRLSGRAAGRRAARDGAAPGRARRVLRAGAEGAQHARLGAAVDQALALQEPGRQDPLAEPVAARRLLGVDPQSGPR